MKNLRRHIRFAEILRLHIIMKKVALLILLLISTSPCFLFAQESMDSGATIKGKVTDETGSPIEIANVWVGRQMKGTTTDLKGEYSLRIATADTVEITFSMIGHQSRRRILVKPSGIITMDIMLPHVNNTLQGVTIRETRRQTGTMQHLSQKQARLLPDATGGTIESFIATQAGVSSTNELSSTYNVRGGNYDENSVYVNGIEIYRPLLIRAGQQEGLSFINPDMVESIGFSSGGFEAKYGDKMSSVLDITYRRPTRLEGSVSAGLLGANAYIGIGEKDKWSMTHSLRYKTNQYLLGTLDTHGEYDPSFVDYQTFLTCRLTEQLEVGFIGNVSQNRYRFTPSDRNTSFGTLEDVKEFKVYFGGREEDMFRTWFGAVTLYYDINTNNRISINTSAYRTDEQETFDIISQYWLNDVDEDKNMGVGTYMEHARNYLAASVVSVGLSGNHKMEQHELHWGAEYKLETISDDLNEWEMRDSAGYSLPHTGERIELIYNLRSQNDVRNHRLSAFVQDTWRKHSDIGLFVINGGVRFSYWSWNQEPLFSPRISVGFIPEDNDKFTFRLATGLYYQSPFYKEFRDTVQAGGSSFVRLNRDIKSQRSIQVVGAMDYQFRVWDRPFKLTTEVYYKALSNLIPYNINNVRLTYYGENCASGYATGLDMKLFGEFIPGTDSWLTASIMSTEEKIDGKWYPRPTDQRFNLSFCLTDYFPGSDRWQMNLRAVYANGLPFGPPHSGREKQLFRAPAYRRVDIGMSYRILNNEERSIRTGWQQHFRNIWLGVDAFNLLGINNVNSYYWITDTENHRYAVPNYLTGRRINARLLIEF